MEKMTKHTAEKPIEHSPIEYEIAQRGGNDGSWEDCSTEDHTQFLYVLQGSYDLRLGGEEFTLPAGSMVLLDGGESYSIRGRRKKRALISLRFLPEVLFGTDLMGSDDRIPLDLVTDMSGRRIFTPDLPSAPLIRSIFERIKEEFAERKFGYRLVVRGEVTRLFAAVIRYRHREGEEAAAAASTGARLFAKKARRYIDEKYPEATMLSAAQACGVSYSYFSRMFKEVMGMSFSDYLNRVRINHSLTALTATDDSITDIALSVGFSSTSYYIQTFRRMKGCSPNRYRKMMGEERE
ncbi:MAG: helix-turn-helix domain-containing protein [Clostridia bacterium]|nr:helix-turn-helix domain-containing protein [Clostridia bacterium]